MAIAIALLCAASDGFAQQPSTTSVRSLAVDDERPPARRRRRRLRCVPDNRVTRVFAEVGGFYLGAAPALLPLLVHHLNGGDFKEKLAPIYISASMLGATLTGALGAWGFGRLTGGNGGYGWTWLGTSLATATFFGPIYSGGLVSAAGAVLGFELSTGATCAAGPSVAPRASGVQWFVSPVLGAGLSSQGVDAGAATPFYGFNVTIVL